MYLSQIGHQTSDTATLFNCKKQYCKQYITVGGAPITAVSTLKYNSFKYLVQQFKAPNIKIASNQTKAAVLISIENVKTITI